MQRFNNPSQHWWLVNLVERGSGEDSQIVSAAVRAVNQCADRGLVGGHAAGNGGSWVLGYACTVAGCILFLAPTCA